jgi:hypothetical protein
MTREELSTMVADVLADHFETLRGELQRLVETRVEITVETRTAVLRGDLLEKLLQLRAPDYQLTPKGELYCDGKRVGDVRPVFRDVVAEVLADQTRPKP